MSSFKNKYCDLLNPGAVIGWKDGNGAFCVRHALALDGTPADTIGTATPTDQEGAYNARSFPDAQAAYDWHRARFEAQQGSMTGYSHLNICHVLEELLAA